MGERIEAYHDGELSGRGRRRIERELRDSPELRAELEDLASLREALCDLDAEGPDPDLWDDVALRLPGIDARRAEAAPARAPGWLGLWGWLHPARAFAAVVVVAVGVAAGLYFEDDPESGQVIRWLDGGDRNVMVIDDDPSTTIIWVLDSVGDGAGRGDGRELLEMV